MNEKTVGMLIGKKNVYEYPELSNAVTCMIVQDCQRIQKTQGNSTFLGSFLFVKI